MIINHIILPHTITIYNNNSNKVFTFTTKEVNHKILINIFKKVKRVRKKDLHLMY